MDLFPPHARGLAMGIKQTGLTVGVVAAALTLPPVAVRWGWRPAVAACAVTVLLPAGLAWRPMRALWPAVADASRP